MTGTPSETPPVVMERPKTERERKRAHDPKKLVDTPSGLTAPYPDGLLEPELDWELY